MVFIYLPATYYHLILDGEFVGRGVFRCPSGLSCILLYFAYGYKSYACKVFKFKYGKNLNL